MLEISFSVFCSFFDIHYPDVFVTAEQGGNLTIRVKIPRTFFLQQYLDKNNTDFDTCLKISN